MSRWATRGLLHYNAEVTAGNLSVNEGRSKFICWVIPKVDILNRSEAIDDEVRGDGSQLLAPLGIEELETLDKNELLTLSLVISAISKIKE